MENEGMKDREGSRSYRAESATWPHETMTFRCGWRETQVALNYYVPYRDRINFSRLIDQQDFLGISDSISVTSGASA